MFRILLATDAIASLAVVYYFLAGLADGSVSSFNIHLWISILLIVAAIVGGGLALRRANRPALANLLLGVLAAPAILYGVFILAVILSGERWN